MAFPARRLHEGEHVVLDLRPHWTGFAACALVLGGALALSVALARAGAPELLLVAAAAGTLVALARFVVGYSRWASTNVVLTDLRLLHRSGVLAKEEVEISLDRVQAVLFRRSLPGRVLRYGDVVLQSGGDAGGSHTIERIARPAWVQSQISRQLSSRERRSPERSRGRRDSG